jgi:hypothetical protein
MNTLEFFLRRERDEVRGDPNEGAAHMVQGRGAILQVKLEGEFKTVGTIRGPIRSWEKDPMNPNVFCMYALRASSASTLVDPRNFAFGDTFALITSHDQFMRRVKDAIREQGHKLAYELVRYVDENSYEGPLGVFTKSSTFAYQSEFRIALLSGTGQPHPLSIGDISDIAVVGPMAEINKRLRVVRNAEGKD